MSRLAQYIRTLKICLIVQAASLLFVPTLLSQIRTEVEFTGLSQLQAVDLELELRKAGLLRPDSLALQAIPRVIETLAAQHGLYFASISQTKLTWNTDSSTARFDIEVEEGPLLFVCDLAFHGAEAFNQEELFNECESKTDKLFFEKTFASDMQHILDLYERHGYPFASLYIETFDIAMDDDRACAIITVAVDEGPPFTISEITVEGNDLTKTHVILRETGLGIGSVFDADKIRDAQRNLERLRFFSAVAEPQLYMREGRGGILLRVTEGTANIFDGVIGYQPPGREGEEGYLTGLVNLSFRNIFGTGRRMDARWERTTQSISELELRYLEPWFLSLPLHLEGGLFQRQQDSLYVRRNLDASVTLLVASDLRITARGNRIDVIPSEFNTISGLRQSVTWSGGAQLLIDTRDDMYNPRSGIQLRNSWDGGSKNSTNAITLEKTVQFIQRIEIDAAAFREIFPRVVAAASLHGRELRGESLDISELYRLGGAATLRGYREEQFSATRLGWLNAEIRYSLGRRSFAFTFYDYGYMFLSADDEQARPETALSRAGYGLGLRLETGLGIMSVSYALGQGDGLGNGKIHFGLINEF